MLTGVLKQFSKVVNSLSLKFHSGLNYLQKYRQLKRQQQLQLKKVQVRRQKWQQQLQYSMRQQGPQ